MNKHAMNPKVGLPLQQLNPYNVNKYTRQVDSRTTQKKFNCLGRFCKVNLRGQ